MKGYATLYPDNIDAQVICKMGIKEVAYPANEHIFAKASKKILENVKCWYIINVNYSHNILHILSPQHRQIKLEEQP